MTRHLRARYATDWPAPPSVPSLGLTDVQVWSASLESDAASWADFLSPAELDRAERFHFELHRRRFIVGRGLLRVVLGRYLRADPKQVQFVCSAHGKPELADAFASSGLRFNLAHCEDLAVLAVTRLGPV